MHGFTAMCLLTWFIGFMCGIDGMDGVSSNGLDATIVSPKPENFGHEFRRTNNVENMEFCRMFSTQIVDQMAQN